MTTTNRTRNDEAKCIGINPWFFEDPAFYRIGLETCDTCPVRLWCMQLVDPAANWYDGVCGGVVWQNGKPVETERTKHDSILATYMRSRKYHQRSPEKRDRQYQPDLVAIDAFIEGHLHWRKLNSIERRIAAKRLWEAGMNRSEISDLTHLSSTTINQLLGKE